MQNIKLQLLLQQHPLNMEVEICDLAENGKSIADFEVSAPREVHEVKAGEPYKILLVPKCIKCINTTAGQLR